MKLTNLEKEELKTLLQDEIENLEFMKDQKGVDNDKLKKKIGVITKVLYKTRGTYDYTLEENLA